MYILYADDAGNTGIDYDNPQQPVFSLAGIVVPQDRWHEINSRINALKRELIPEYENVEIHATEIFNGKKNAAKGYDFRKNSPQQNRGILERFVNFIVEEALPIIYFSVRKSYLKEYCKRHYGNAVKLDPYVIAFPYVTSFFDEFVKAKGEKGLIMLDEQNAMVGKVDTVLAMIRGTEASSPGFHADDIIETALFLESFKSNFIQLADICNFYINRYLSMLNGVEPSPDKQEHFEKMFLKLKAMVLAQPFDPFQETSLFGFFDENNEILKK